MMMTDQLALSLTVQIAAHKPVGCFHVCLGHNVGLWYFVALSFEPFVYIFHHDLCCFLWVSCMIH